jgi:hypothetical protein
MVTNDVKAGLYFLEVGIARQRFLATEEVAEEFMNRRGPLEDFAMP